VSIDERRNRATRSFLLSDTHSGGPGRVAPVANIFKNAIPQPRNCPTEIAQPIKHKDEKDTDRECAIPTTKCMSTAAAQRGQTTIKTGQINIL